MTINHDTALLILSSVATTFVGYVSLRVNKYINEREKSEKKKEAKAMLHYINLDALIDSLETTFTEKFGPNSKEEFKKRYYAKRAELMKEEKEINIILEHM